MRRVNRISQNYLLFIGRCRCMGETQMPSDFRLPPSVKALHFSGHVIDFKTATHKERKEEPCARETFPIWRGFYDRMRATVEAAGGRRKDPYDYNEGPSVLTNEPDWAGMGFRYLFFYYFVLLLHRNTYSKSKWCVVDVACLCCVYTPARRHVRQRAGCFFAYKTPADSSLFGFALFAAWSSPKMGSQVFPSVVKLKRLASERTTCAAKQQV